MFGLASLVILGTLRSTRRFLINICSVPEKWRKTALFFECPKRHFSALQTPRRIGILQSAVRYVRGVWLAGGAEPGAIFHRGDTSELRVASRKVGPGAREDRHLSPVG